MPELGHALPVAGRKHNRYCGPAAMAAMTGLDTGECARIMREVNGLYAVRGLHINEMIKALNHAGVETELIEYKGDQSLPEWERYKTRPTLNQWLKLYNNETPVIVVAGNHYWAVQGEHYVDSFNRLPTPLGKIRQPKARVEAVIILK